MRTSSLTLNKMLQNMTTKKHHAALLQVNSAQSPTMDHEMLPEQTELINLAGIFILQFP